MSRAAFFFLLLFVSHWTCEAAIFEVGSTKSYLTPNALYQAGLVADGDTIEIQAETFTGQPALAVWSANDLLIRGVAGKPNLEAAGENIWGKGIWVLAGNNITVENIEFSGATVADMNGAGIRLDGIGMTARYCYFHENENGILTSNPEDGDILIEYCEFEANGFGDGQSHNLYVGHVNSLTFRYNYSHHAIIGHNLKSRADENYILYNRIMDEESGNSSMLIDLPNGGFSIVMGNVLMQGENAENNKLITYGLEGLLNSTAELYVINNTMVNKRVASCIFVATEVGTTVNMANNILAGSGTFSSGPTPTTTGNLVEPDIAAVQFMNEAAYNYKLFPASAAIDYGSALGTAGGFSLVPDEVYEHPTDAAARSIINGAIDAGAYESGTKTGVYPSQTAMDVQLYPNPFTKTIRVATRHANQAVGNLYSLQGKKIASFKLANDPSWLDLSALSPGVYVLEITSDEGKGFRSTIIKRQN